MRKRDISYISIIIILVVIILILLFSSKFGKIDNDTRVPTGNVDVFDINIDCKNKNECKQDIEKAENTLSSDDVNITVNKRESADRTKYEPYNIVVEVEKTNGEKYNINNKYYWSRNNYPELK